MKIKNVKNDVKNLLINKHHLRDDDRKLIASVWYKEINTLDISAIDDSSFC